MIGKFKNREEFLQDELKRSSQANTNKLELIDKLEKQKEELVIANTELKAKILKQQEYINQLTDSGIKLSNMHGAILSQPSFIRNAAIAGNTIYGQPMQISPDPLTEEDVRRIVREEISKAQVEQLGNNPVKKDWYNFGMFRVVPGEEK